MSDKINSIQSDKNMSNVLTTESAQDKLEGNSKHKIADALLMESNKFSDSSNKQAQKAQEYLQAADALEQAATAVRARADQMRKGQIKEEEKTKKVVEVPGSGVQIPIPKDATPELLEKMAESLEAKAKENRRMADDLLKESEGSKRMANQLQEHADLISKKDMSVSDLQAKSMQAHNEGLNMVFKKLGVYKLDSEYKEQVAYSHQKESDKMQRGI